MLRLGLLVITDEGGPALQLSHGDHKIVLIGLTLANLDANDLLLV